MPKTKIIEGDYSKFPKDFKWWFGVIYL